MYILVQVLKLSSSKLTSFEFRYDLPPQTKDIIPYAGLSLRFSSMCAKAEIVLYFELPENCGLLSISYNRWQAAQGRIQLDGTCSAFLGDKGTTVESSRRIIYQVA